ncbi:MAG: ABC-2 family transporter protein [Patescibacteria group bacterium]
MRYFRIFLLHFQDVFQNRGRSFIYFLMALLNPALQLLFWSGAIASNAGIESYWSFSDMASYYLLLTIATSFLVVHIEQDVAFLDIKEGRLSKFLLHPFPYFISKFMEELPWRIIQGLFGLGAFMLFIIITRISISFISNPLQIIVALVICLLALGISYTLKMILGLLALWTTDFWGILSIEEVIFLIFGGFVMPLTYYPELLEKVSYFLPIAYIVYFPVIAVQGKLTINEMYQVVIVQLIWVGVLYGLYRLIWHRGIRKYTGVGQ